ncbi:uncharacterized protein VICG_01032, partial [Vittaforma corneae ATCC 50505]
NYLSTVATLVLQLTPLLPNYSSVLLPISLPSKMFHHTPKISTFLVSFLLISTTYLYPPSIFVSISLPYFSIPLSGTLKPHVSFCPVLHSGHLCGTFALPTQKFPPAGSPATTPRCCFPSFLP